jgi:hypothetical protein
LLGDIVHEPCLHYLFSAAGLRAVLDAFHLIVMSEILRCSGTLRIGAAYRVFAKRPTRISQANSFFIPIRLTHAAGKHYSLLPVI